VTAEGLRILSPPPAGTEGILSAEAQAFLTDLHRLFEPIRQSLLARRAAPGSGRLRDAAAILDGLVEKDEFTEFPTLPAYPYLE
jgi:hypothetical protein